MRGKHSEGKIREYVERELDRTVRVTHPDLTVVQGDQWEDTAVHRRRRSLAWTIEGRSGGFAGDYVIEARAKEGELLVWFGYSSAGAFWTHHLVRPAVHLDLEELKLSVNRYRSEAFSLGAVLEWMLSSGKRASDMCFPMNHCALT